MITDPPCEPTDVTFNTTDSLCYRIATNTVNARYKAHTSCTDSGMNLATINSPELFDELQQYLLNTSSGNNGYWIGLRLNEWKWALDGNLNSYFYFYGIYCRFSTIPFDVYHFIF